MQNKIQKFIIEAKIIHNDKYDYSKSNYINVDTKLEIICNEKNHGSFFQTPYKHIKRKQGCPICGIEKSKRKRTKPFEIFLKQAKEIHGDKYDYSLAKRNYKGAFSKIEIICKKHGKFTQTPDNHVNDKKGCYQCGLDKNALLYLRTQDEFIELARKVHKDRYDYSLVEYRGADEKIFIICKEHGKWLQNPTSHLKGHNCPKCTGNSGLTTKMFIEKAIKKHGDLYDYSNVKYINAHSKVIISCHKHGFFEQTPSDHIYSTGKGCPKCKETTGERLIRLYLEKHQIQYVYQKTFKNCINKSLLRYDFYLPKKEILIEFDGIQHFEAVKIWGGKKALTAQQLRDKIKNKCALKMKIKLIRIKYSEIQNIETILDKLIKTA